MYIIVVGGGNVGYYLTKTLITEGYEVTLMDWDHHKVDLLSIELGDSVMYGTGTSIEGLDKAGCCRADVIVAATGHDEDNLAICQMGKKYFNVPKAIARITNPKNERVFKELGVETTVCGTSAIVETLERYVAKKSITKLLSFAHDEMTLVETELTSDATAVNQTISSLVLPENCIIALIIRGKNVIFPKGNTELMDKDIILAISTRIEVESLKKALLGQCE